MRLFLRLMGSPMGAKGCSEGVVVDEGKQHSIWSSLSHLQQQELCLGWNFVRLCAPLWGHPPELASSTSQEPLAIQLQRHAICLRDVLSSAS